MGDSSCATARAGRVTPRDAGVPLKAIQELIGHRTMTMTKSARPSLGPESSKLNRITRNYGGGGGNRTRVREAFNDTSFTCVVAVSPATGFADSAATYSSLSLSYAIEDSLA